MQERTKNILTWIGLIIVPPSTLWLIISVHDWFNFSYKYITVIKTHPWLFAVYSFLLVAVAHFLFLLFKKKKGDTQILPHKVLRIIQKQNDQFQIYRENIEIQAQLIQCENDITEVHVNYAYTLHNLSNRPVQPVIIYRCPIGFVDKGMLSHMTKMVIRSKNNFSVNNFNYERQQLDHYALKDTYGLFYNFPLTLQIGESLVIEQRAVEYYPKEDDLVFYSHYPANQLRLEIITPNSGLRVRARYYHPLKYAILEADKVEIHEDSKSHYYLLSEGLLPFQGIRMWWEHEF